MDTALAAVPGRYALERGAWAEAAVVVPRRSVYPYATGMGYFARVLGAAKLGGAENLSRARQDLEKLRALREEHRGKPDQEYWADQTQVLVGGAAGWLAHAEGDDAEALARLRDAANLEDASEKHVAMENRLFPMRELLGYLLLELRQADRALAEFEALVEGGAEPPSRTLWRSAGRGARRSQGRGRRGAGSSWP